MTQTPSKFTMNSDYLSIAQVERNTYNVYLGGGSLTVGGYTEQNFDFASTAPKGAVDRILISKDGGEYRLGSYMTLIPVWSGSYDNNIAGFIQVLRTSATNIRAQVVLENYASTTSTYPAMVFSIKVSSFEPPNVF